MSATAAVGEWRVAVAPYARPDVALAALDVATSVVPYLTLLVAMHAMLGVSPFKTLDVASFGYNSQASVLASSAEVRASFRLLTGRSP